MKWYFTLTQEQEYTLPLPDGDIVWGPHGVVCVQADSVDTAEMFMSAMFGEELISCYSELEFNLKPYMNGVIHTYIIPPETEIVNASLIAWLIGFAIEQGAFISHNTF